MSHKNLKQEQNQFKTLPQAQFDQTQMNKTQVIQSDKMILEKQNTEITPLQSLNNRSLKLVTLKTHTKPHLLIAFKFKAKITNKISIQFKICKMT